MFGAFRYLLALLVVLIHGLTQSDIDALRDRVRGVARAATSETL